MEKKPASALNNGLIEMTETEWRQKGKDIFGENTDDWKFVCPTCGHIASVKEYKDAGAESGMIGFSCIGRLLENPRDAFDDKNPGPCNYAGGGLFQLNPILITDHNIRVFAFAEGTDEL